MRNEFKRIIKKYNILTKGDRVCVGVSGGADSVALIVLLNELKKEYSLKLVAVHVNHNIRGNEAERDEKFVRELCSKLEIDYIKKSVNATQFSKDNKKTLEQGARELRHKALKEVMDELGLTKLALAHNKDDQAETVLMHLFRGSGLSGTAGMNFVDGNIIRPLLGVGKREILEFLTKEGIPYVIDSSNLDDNYTRNYLRNTIIPQIEKVYPSVKDSLCAYSRKVRENNEYITETLPKGVMNKKGNSVILSNELKNEVIFLQKRLVREALKQIDSLTDVEEKHIGMVISLLELQVGKVISLPNGTCVLKTYDGLEFFKRTETEFSEKRFEVEDKFNVPLGEIVISKVNTPKFGTGLYVDLEKIPSTAVWRNHKRGDKFTKFSGGTKSLSDYLTNKKIDSSTRKKMVVLADGEDVLVIPDVEISSKVKLDSNTKEVIRICLVK